MNYRMIGRIIGQILGLEALFLLPPLLLCLCDGDGQAALGFTLSILISSAVYLLLSRLCRRAESGFRAKEGLVCVSLAWIAMSFLGCLPFVLSGAIPNLVDALFETVSGFTTTGASYPPSGGGYAGQRPLLALLYQLAGRHGRAGLCPGHLPQKENGQRRR